MVISHSRRFIYWKPHKVASTSVMYALSQQCTEHDSCGGIGGKVEVPVENYRRNMGAFSHLPTNGNHAAPEDIKQLTNILWGENLWDEYYKFTIVRNPWDWAVSLMDYAENTLGTRLSFDDVAQRSQRHYWFSESGKPLADHYIRYEHLSEDYAAVCTQLGLPQQQLPKLRLGQRDKAKPYWEYYSAETQALIARTFELEIDHFSYRFGD